MDVPTTEGGFDMIQNHRDIDLLSGKVHAVPSRATATAADAAEIIRNMCLRSGDGFPDVLVVDHDPKFTSAVFRAFVKSMGLCLIVGYAYHKTPTSGILPTWYKHVRTCLYHVHTCYIQCYSMYHA